MTDDSLAHYGVKGMQWGVRRQRSANGRVTKSSSDFKSTKDLRKRPSHTLSNMQLKQINERMQLESKYSQMNPSKVAKGHAVVKSVIAAAGTVTAANKLMSSAAGMARSNAGKKAVKFATTRSPAEYERLLSKR